MPKTVNNIYLDSEETEDVENSGKINLPESVGIKSIQQIDNDTFLQFGSFRSPYYVIGKQGWSINSDGTAEFRNITSLGNINAIKSFQAGEDLEAMDAVCVLLNSHSLDLEQTSTQYASIIDATQAGLDFTTLFTIECWVKVESFSGSDQTIVSKYDDTLNERAYLFSYDPDGKLKITLSDDGTGTDTNFQIYTTTANQLTAGTWYHVAVTVDMNSGTPLVIFYVNGLAVANSKTTGTTIGSSLHNSAAAFAVGTYFSNGVANTASHDGLIDELRVWSLVRTAAEIFNNQSTLLTGSETDLEGYWQFNNNYTDITSNANTLTSSGSPTFTTTVAFESTKIFRTDASIANTTNAFIGFVTSSYLTGIQAVVFLSSVVSGFTDLRVGGQYYLSNTPGEISLIAGTVSRKVGIGISSTELMITNNW